MADHQYISYSKFACYGNKRSIFLGILLLLFSSSGIAQQKASVKAQARAYPDKITLRWAVNKAAAWHYTHQYGYGVEKYLLLQNGHVLVTPEKMPLPKATFKVWPLNQWKALVEKEDQAAIAAQAVYGESFETTHTSGTDILKIVQKSREQEMRFAFALMAADQSFEVAQALGTGLTDTQVKKGEKYLYKIFTRIPASVEPVDTAYVYVGVDDYKPLPAVREFYGEFGDKSVFLSWNTLYYTDLYVGYRIERSPDNKTFQSITELPVTNPLRERRTADPGQMMFKVDTLPQNDHPYYYRIRGINAFGEAGPPSEVISGRGSEALVALPVMQEVALDDAGTVTLSWEFPTEKEKLLRGFQIEKASKIDGLYQNVSETLSPAARSHQLPHTGGVGYYRVAAFTSGGERNHTYPYLVQAEDSIPPSVPVALEGKIDTTGIVSLHWTPSPEDDVQGYRIYRSNFPDAEFYQLTSGPVADTTFTDSLTLKTLTKKVYYKVIATDVYYNNSAYSEALELVKPDQIPPVAPLFSKVISSDSSVYLGWQPSTSEDVAKHVLYRTGKVSNQWELLATFEEDSITHFSDESIAPGQDWRYTLIAVDESGLESAPAQPVTARIVDSGLREGIKGIVYEVDTEQTAIRFRWNLPYETVDYIQVYRARGEEALQLYQSIAGDLSEFTDTKISSGYRYQYRFRAVYKEGGKSGFSEVLSVGY